MVSDKHQCQGQDHPDGHVRSRKKGRGGRTGGKCSDETLVNRIMRVHASAYNHEARMVRKKKGGGEGEPEENAPTKPWSIE